MKTMFLPRGPKPDDLRSSTMQTLHRQFIESIAVMGTGLSVAVIDLLKSGTVIVGLCGAILGAVGGYEAWRAKRLERQIREIELKRVKMEDVDES
jgi:uncharacterized membrane protein